MKLPPDLLDDLLRRWPVARLATVRPDGSPHLVPVVFCAVDEVLYSPLDAKRKSSRDLQRFANVAANPLVSLLLDDYADDWTRLWWVRIDAAADRFEPGAGAQSRIAGRLLAKYPQYRDLPPPQGASTYLRMIPRRTTAWSQSGTLDVITERLVYASRASG